MRLIRDDLRAFHPDSSAEVALEAFQALTDSPAEFIKRGSTAEDVFWSRYFWFCLFVGIRGSDVGFEQQAFQLLEYPFPTCEPDWSQLESVEALARQAASTWLEHNRRKD